jgi:hypothetical protein
VKTAAAVLPAASCTFAWAPEASGLGGRSETVAGGSAAAASMSHNWLLPTLMSEARVALTDMAFLRESRGSVARSDSGAMRSIPVGILGYGRRTKTGDSSSGSDEPKREEEGRSSSDP